MSICYICIIMRPPFLVRKVGRGNILLREAQHTRGWTHRLHFGLWGRVSVLRVVESIRIKENGWPRPTFGTKKCLNNFCSFILFSYVPSHRCCVSTDRSRIVPRPVNGTGRGVKLRRRWCSRCWQLQGSCMLPTPHHFASDFGDPCVESPSSYGGGRIH